MASEWNKTNFNKNTIFIPGKATIPTVTPEGAIKVNTSYGDNMTTPAITIAATPYSMQAGKLVRGTTVTPPAAVPVGNVGVNIDTTYGANSLNASAALAGEYEKNKGGVTAEGEVTTPSSVQTPEAFIDTSYKANNGMLYQNPSAVNGYTIPTYGDYVASDGQKNTNNGTGTAAPSTTVDSYEEYLQKMQEGYKDIRDTSYAAAEKAREEALRQADIRRQRAIVDARTSYEQSKATYGARAEALASMGLTGGGYSDYVDAQSYAAHRADVQAANAAVITTEKDAKYAEEQAKLAADLSYKENMMSSEKEIAAYKEQQKADKRTAYLTLYDAANTGGYTAQQLKSLSDEYRLSAEEKETLLGVSQDYNYNSFLDAISSGSADTASIDKAYQNEDISEPQYNDLKSKWNKSISDDISFSLDGVSMTRSEARSAIDSLLNTEWLDEPTKEALESKFKEEYSPVTRGIINNSGDEATIVNLEDDFQVEDARGNKYWVMSGGVVNDENIEQVAAAAKLKDGSVFGYDQNLYIYHNGRAYLLTATGNGVEYKNLYAMFFGS